MEHPQDLAQAISIREQIFRVDCASFAAYVVLYYDYLLTLADEIRLFWSVKRLTVNAAIFYLNRYIALSGHIPLILGRYLLSEESKSLLKYHQYLAGTIQVVSGFALIHRTYALYGRRRVLYPLCILGLGVIGFGIWALHGMKPPPLGLFERSSLPGCILPLHHEDAFHYAGAWAGMLVFDFTVFLMTAYKSFARWKEDRFHRDISLIHILARDGAIYFGVMVLLTISVIVSLFVMPEYEKAITAVVANVLSSVMISRFMFNLRAPFIIGNRNVWSTTASMGNESTFSINEEEIDTNGSSIIQPLDVTPSQITLLLNHQRGRTPSDATSVTAIHALHHYGLKAGEEAETGLMGDTGKH